MKFKIRIKKTFRRKHRNTKRRTHRRQKGGNNLQVFYGEQLVAGQELPKNLTQSEPSVRFPTTGKLYTLVMWDPDVPPQAQPGFAHWIAINIQSTNDISANQLLDYKGPAPPSGIHRYFFGLFEQAAHIRPQQPPRSNFNMKEFVEQNNLTKVAQVFMKVSAT
jgi:phosphatidylethanolamine-binding protein (PEBP) family uncharacterized protein